MSRAALRELVRADVTIRYQVCGPRWAPTLVFLHGATLDRHSWDPQWDALRHRFRVVTVDLRGHGQSTMAGRFAFDAAVEDVLALLERLDADRVVLIGLSLGGNIAQEVVYRAPELVDALVVADATCHTAIRHPFQVPMTIVVLACRTMFYGESLRHRAAQAAAREDEIRRYVLSVNKRHTAGQTLQILTSLLTALHPEPDYRLPVPTLLIHGAEDGLGDITAGIHAWAQREPLAECVTVPRAGHLSNQDNPDAFTAALATFLDRVFPPSRWQRLLRFLRGGPGRRRLDRVRRGGP